MGFFESFCDLAQPATGRICWRQHRAGRRRPGAGDCDPCDSLRDDLGLSAAHWKDRGAVRRGAETDPHPGSGPGCGAAPLALQQPSSSIPSTTLPQSSPAAVIGASDPVHTIDSIWEQGGAVAGYLFQQRRCLQRRFWLLHRGSRRVGYSWGCCVCTTMFLIALSHVALGDSAGSGALFLSQCCWFDSTRRLFDAWLAQLTNYALITLLDCHGRRAPAASRE